MAPRWTRPFTQRCIALGPNPGFIGWAPLAELTQVPQETAVLAYPFGDGFTNMVVATSALVLGTLALGKIPYGAWVKFVTPLLLKSSAMRTATCSS